jgi:hypothetical protein
MNKARVCEVFNISESPLVRFVRMNRFVLRDSDDDDADVEQQIGKLNSGLALI